MSPVEILIGRTQENEWHSKEEIEIFELLNRERIIRGLPLLKLDHELSLLARGHSIDMANHSFFDHINHKGEDVGDRLRVWRFDFSKCAENLALNQSVEEAHKGLMRSPGHRRNILDPEFRVVGIGASSGEEGKYITQVFKG